MRRLQGKKAFLPAEGCVFVAGLGNRAITPDALGPRTAAKVLATRHFSQAMTEEERSCLPELRPVCVLAGGVLGQTGMESAELIHAVCCHGYGICTDVEPTLQMEKILFAADELTGLIGAAAKMRPSKSCTDMELSSLKKKFKDKKFAAGCSRDVIRTGAERLGWTLDELLEKTLHAMADTESTVAEGLNLLLQA